MLSLFVNKVERYDAFSCKVKLEFKCSARFLYFFFFLKNLHKPHRIVSAVFKGVGLFLATHL